MTHHAPPVLPSLASLLNAVARRRRLIADAAVRYARSILIPQRRLRHELGGGVGQQLGAAGTAAAAANSVLVVEYVRDECAREHAVSAYVCRRVAAAACPPLAAESLGVQNDQVLLPAEPRLSVYTRKVCGPCSCVFDV